MSIGEISFLTCFMSERRLTCKCFDRNPVFIVILWPQHAHSMIDSFNRGVLVLAAGQSIGQELLRGFLYFFGSLGPLW